MHARKALLEGLSPKDNRSIPPLDYGLVYALKRAHPDWPIILNGGVQDLEAARAHLEHVDGVMLGRAAYQNPELLIDVDPALFGEAAPVADAFEAIEAFMPTIARGLARGERLHDYTRHLHGVFAGRAGARAYRQTLACEAIRRGGWARRFAEGARLRKRKLEAPHRASGRTPACRRAMGGGIGDLAVRKGGEIRVAFHGSSVYLRGAISEEDIRREIKKRGQPVHGLPTLTTRKVRSCPSSSRTETYSPTRKAWSPNR